MQAKTQALRPAAPRWQTALVLSGLLLVVLSAFASPIDRLSDDYLAQSFNRALAAFAIARGINGVVSVAQGTELAVQPAGVGVNFAPGEILDPVNDLIERFSWAMLAAGSSLGVQRVLLEMSTWVGVSVLLALSALCVAYRFAQRRWHWQDWSNKCLLIALFLRFALPLSALTNELVYQQFLADSYQVANQQLEQTRDQLGKMNQQWQQSAADQSTEEDLLSRARQWLDEARRSLSVDEHMAKLQAVAQQATHSTVDMLVVFLMQTLILPLLFFWLLWQLGRSLLR